MALLRLAAYSLASLRDAANIFYEANELGLAGEGLLLEVANEIAARDSQFASQQTVASNPAPLLVCPDCGGPLQPMRPMEGLQQLLCKRCRLSMVV